MIRACLFLLAGVYALQLSSFDFDSDLIATAMVALFVALVVGKTRLVLLLIAGVAIFTLAALEIFNSRIAPQFVGDSIVTQVRIVDFPKSNLTNVSLVAETIGNTRLPRRIRVSWYKPPVPVRFGDIWQFELRLRRPRGSINPGGFDYEAWLLRERIGAIGYVVDGRRNQLLRSGELHMTERVRLHVVNRVIRLIPETEHAAVLAAISVGARHLVTPQQWQRYARTGTSHLMAISGLHVGMAAAGGYFLAAILGGLSRWRRNQHLAATMSALFVAACYAVFSGLGIPAQRASLMIALLATAVLAGRQVRPLTIIATACVVVVLLSPLATMTPGFKLSFSAVLILIWLARRYPGRNDRRRMLRPLTAIRQLGAVQLALLLGLLPLTVLLFSRIAFAAPLVNLIAVPIFSFVTVPFTLAGLLLDGALQAAGDRALLAAAFSLKIIESLIVAVADLPWASLTTTEISHRAWLYLVMPLAWVVFPPGWPGRTVAFVAVVALVLYQPPRPPAGCADIDTLDVGQGLSIVVTTRKHVVVYDAGPAFRSGGSAAATVVLPFLANRGIDRVDKLVVSHADLDHAGGIAAIVANVEVLDMRVGEPLAGLVSSAVRCLAGERWRYDGVEFYFVHPAAPVQHDGNDASCVLMIQTGDRRALLTGDIERPVENELVRSGAVRDVDAVIVPHHGSRTSSSLPFVHALRPSVAIVSASYGNRWGFPKDDVVERWHAAGAQVLVTSTSGAIGMRLCEEGGVVSLVQHRTQQRRIWHE